jgi:hypothetical protein
VPRSQTFNYRGASNVKSNIAAVHIFRHIIFMQPGAAAAPPSAAARAQTFAEPCSQQ